LQQLRIELVVSLQAVRSKDWVLVIFEKIFPNAISDGSDEEGNPVAGGRAVAAAPVVPANAVAAALVNQGAVDPVGAANAGADGVVENASAPVVAVNAAMGDGVDHAAGGRKRGRGS
jgi:hypothetical protein